MPIPSPPSDARPIVDLVKVTKVYIPDIIALQDISLTVNSGEILFCTGMSGAGKSTLIKLVCCLESPTKGVVEVAGHDLAKMKPVAVQQLRQQIGVAYQDFKLLSRQSVFRNVAMALEVAYHPPRQIQERVMELLEILHLAKLQDKLAGKLSRGEQQRVALARAAVNSPTLLLADEPTGNLDPEAGGWVLDLFERLRAAGTTLIVATHDRRLFAGSTHRVVHLHQGRLAEGPSGNGEANGMAAASFACH